MGFIKEPTCKASCGEVRPGSARRPVDCCLDRHCFLDDADGQLIAQEAGLGGGFALRSV